jgi:hypothetical protein
MRGARQSPAAHLLSPSLTLPHPAHCTLVERREVGERQGELGADFTSFLLPTFLACHPRVKVACHQRFRFTRSQQESRSQTVSIDETVWPDLGPEQDNFCCPFPPNPFVPEVFAIKIRRMGSADVFAPLGMGPKQRGIWWLLQRPKA